MTDQVLALEERWAKAISDCDLSAAARILDDDFILTSAIWRDREITKQEWLETLRDLSTRAISCHDFEARTFGDIAVATGRLHWEAIWKDTDVSDDYLVTDVWVSREGGWRVAWRSSNRLSGQRTEHSLRQTE